MNLDHLRYFEVLAQLEHYGKAAEKLHISQPDLTYAVSQIEQELGTPLFEKEEDAVIAGLVASGFGIAVLPNNSGSSATSSLPCEQESGVNGTIFCIAVRLPGRAFVGICQCNEMRGTGR